MNRVANIIFAMLVSLIIALCVHAVTSLCQSTSYERIVRRSLVIPTEGFESIGGLFEVKERVNRELVSPLRTPVCFEHDELHPPRGVLFCGPPGVGKTMLARAVAKESGVPFFSLALSDLEQRYYGDSPKVVSAAFNAARRASPSIIFLDEVDGILRKRSILDQDCSHGLKTHLLAEMDGVRGGSDAVVVIACTNNPGILDPAVRRRLPRVFAIQLPNTEERLDILKKITPELDRSSIEEVANFTFGASGSDLHDLYRTASSLRLRDNFEEIEKSGFDITKLRPMKLEDWIMAWDSRVDV